MPHLLRIAVLVCDSLIGPVQAEFGTYGDIFEQFLQRGFESFNFPKNAFELQVSKHDVVEAQRYPDMNEVDAVLLTGSRHDSFSSQPWIIKLVQFIRTLHEEGGKPIIGICFGHQIIARALGARIGRNPAGWEVSAHRITLTERGSKLMGGVGHLILYQMHQDMVHEIPGGCVSIGYSELCNVQGFYSPKHIFSLQAHPEFNEAIISKILAFRNQQGVFDEKTFAEAVSRIHLAHDGNLVASAIFKFLLDFE